MTHCGDDILTNMCSPQETMRINSRAGLKKCFREIVGTWDANTASRVKYFVFADESANMLTRDPNEIDMELVMMFKLIMRRCRNLQLLAFHKHWCTTLAEINSISHEKYGGQTPRP